MNQKFNHNAIKSGVNVKCKTNYGENIIYFNEFVLNICVDVRRLIWQGGERDTQINLNQSGQFTRTLSMKC